MLILAGVTINISLSGKLFDYAKKAKVDTETAAEEQNEMIENIMDKEFRGK